MVASHGILRADTTPFYGMWKGWWISPGGDRPMLEASLQILKADGGRPNEITITYTWGESRDWRVTPGFRTLTRPVEGGSFGWRWQFSDDAHGIRFTITGDDTLYGEYHINDRKTAEIVMSRDK